MKQTLKLLAGLLLAPLGDQLGDHRVFGALVVLLCILDVDLPAGQAGRQPYVLALPADRQAQLVVGHEHVGVMAFWIHQPHHLHAGRAEGVRDVLARIR
jgi:hypothetical protein